MIGRYVTRLQAREFHLRKDDGLILCHEAPAVRIEKVVHRRPDDASFPPKGICRLRPDREWNSMDG